MKTLLIKLIKAYQAAPLPTHSACKYHPTCSEYMLEAIEYHGAFKGFFMGIGRLLRCNPFSKGGYDPVKK